tara:strand:+ start:228 stop:713 length:486 start_codon:yes stop_codon:yes gene_type:complete
MDPYMINELIIDYNNNPQRYSDAEAETIAILAQAIGSDFNRESKAFSKGLFDLVDTAALGLIPNEYRPTSRGESVFGETGAERLAGLLGTGAGVVGGIGGAYKAGRGLMGSSKAREVGGKVKQAGERFADAGRAVGSSMGNPLDRIRERLGIRTPYSFLTL